MQESGSNDKIKVAYTGSVIAHIAPVRQAMVAALKKAAPKVKVMEEAANSLEGALWRARGGK